MVIVGRRMTMIVMQGDDCDSRQEDDYDSGRMMVIVGRRMTMIVDSDARG